MPKYDFSYGTLNDIRMPVVGPSYDMTNPPNRYDSAIKAAEMAFTHDLLDDTGPYKAVVLRVESVNSGEVEPEGFLDFVFSLFSGDDKPSGSTLKKMTAIKARVPEIHGHLPIPTGDGDPGSPPNPDYPDHHIIDMYPTYTSESDMEYFSKVKPGDIVIVDYGDKQNFADPIFVTPIAVQQHIPSVSMPSGQGTFSNLPCTLPSGEVVGNAMAGSTDASGHTGFSAGSARSRSTNAKAVMFGDSEVLTQLGAGMMRSLADVGYTIVKPSMWPDRSPRMGAAGSSVSSWVKDGKEKIPASAGKFGFIEDAIKEHDPEAMIICLGADGGTGGAGNVQKLLTKIHVLSPKVKILWIGAIPPSKITDMEKAKKIWGWSADKDPMHFVNTHTEARKAINEAIARGIRRMDDWAWETVAFEDPFRWMPGYQENPGPGADGLHCSSIGAVQLTSIFRAECTGPNCDEDPRAQIMKIGKAQRKPKFSNKAGQAQAAAKQESYGLTLQELKQIYGGARAVGSGTNYSYLSARHNETRESAESFLRSRAGFGATFDELLSRDWIGGFLIEDMHAPSQSIDTSHWKPVRMDELAYWLGYSSYPLATYPNAPYGDVVLHSERDGPGAADPSIDVNPSNTRLGPMNWELKYTSYEMSAAIFMYTYGSDPEPVVAATGRPPPCKPIQTYHDSGASSPAQMAPVGPEVDAGGSGRPFQMPPAKYLSEIDFNKYPQWMVTKWGRGRGFSGNWDSLGDTIKQKSLMSMAAAEIMERYWKQLFPDAQVHIKSHLRRSGNPISSNHGYGAAMDWEVRYGGGLYLPNLYTWASSHYLMNTKRLPPSGGGTYLNMNVPQSNKYRSSKPPGITGIGLAEQGKPAARSCPAPGSSTNTHYDCRGHANHKIGRGKTAWIHLDTDGDGHDDIKGTVAYKAWLKTYHPKGQLIVDFIQSWINGSNMQPEDFKFPQMSNAVPNWNQVCGREPFGPAAVS